MVVETVILVIAAFVAGYIWGKRTGRNAGVKEGQSAMPLILREQSYEMGRCIICNRTIEQRRPC